MSDLALDVKDGKVILHLFDEGGETRTEVVFDAENARQFSEQLARAAYEAHYGRPPINGGSQVSAQMHQDAENRMVVMLHNYDKSPDRKIYWAKAIVAAVRNILG